MSKFYQLSVQKIHRETPNAVSITFSVPENLKEEFSFIPGQYVTIKKNMNGEELRRAYSICSLPESTTFCIAIKAVMNGKFSVYATSSLKEGDVLEVSKPEGKFILETNAENSKNYLAIAAGSGITPIMAMIKKVLSTEPLSTFTLIYGNKTEEETLFFNEIETLKSKFSNTFFVHYVFSRKQYENTLFGRIDKANLNYLLKNKLTQTSFNKTFICGPEEMINSVKETLIHKKFSEKNILFELFSTKIEAENLSAIYEGSCNITVIVDDDDETFTMNTKSTILTAALKQGLDVPYSCQGGICSSCMAKVTEGKAVMDKNSILNEAEIEQGLILTCQAHPITEKITVDYDNIQ